MSFVKKKGKEVDLSVWEHLDLLKVTNMYGRPLNRVISEVIMDKENDYYLVCGGVTNPNFDGEEVYYYSFCVQNDVIRFEVKRTDKGNAADCSLEFHWNIVKATPHKSKIMPTTKEKHPTKKPSAQIISCFSSQGKQNQADRVFLSARYKFDNANIM